MTIALRKWQRIVCGFLIVAMGLGGLALWFSGVRFAKHDTLFRGKPVSEWMKGLKYRDDEQAKEWRGHGEEGIDVLIRGLETANRPGERAYRKLYRKMPEKLHGWLPDPKDDELQSMRHCIVALLSSIGEASARVVPVMIQTALNDESEGIRQSAIGHFITTNGEDTLGNKLPPAQKLALLPALIRAVENGDSGAHNAVILLKFYQTQADDVVPVLQKALNSSQPSVRAYAAEALNRVSPKIANEVRATEVLIEIANHPDDQIAHRAVSALGRATNCVELAAPALLKLLQNTNTLVACEAVWALEWAPREFNSQAVAITNGLNKAAERKDNVGGYARAALKRWQQKTLIAK